MTDVALDLGEVRQYVLDVMQHHVGTRVLHLVELLAGKHERRLIGKKCPSYGAELTFVYRFFRK
jgi:hypothetical protein